MMTRLGSWVVCIALLASVSACPKRKNAGDDGGSDGAVAVVEAGSDEPSASNSNDIARFGDENKLSNETADTASSAVARKSPPNGEVVATIPKGTTCTKIADREGSVLVVFPNPKNASDTLMGWVPQSSFGGAAHTGGGHVASKDGGVAPVDAGAPAAADAGGAVAPVDAAPPPPVADAAPASLCPAGQVQLLPGKCVPTCSSAAQCKPNQQCTVILIPLEGRKAPVCFPPSP